MKVLHILYSGLGGVFKVVDTLISQNDNTIKNFALYIGPKTNKDIFNHKKKLKKKFKFIKIKRFISFYYIFRIFKDIKMISPKIIVLHNFQIFPCILAKLFLSTKIIYVDHQSLPTKNFKDYFILIISYLFIDHYVVLNKDNFNLIHKKFFIKKKKISLIQNSVKFLKKEKKKKSTYFKVGMAGRINNKKLHSLIIQAVHLVQKKNVKIKCFFAGNGEGKKKLKDFIKKKKIKDINFDGELDSIKLSKWYKKLDLYIHASIGEGSSLSILEAINNSTPVIGSNVSGIRDLNLNNKGLVLFNNYPQELKRKILSFYYMKEYSLKKIITKQNEYLKKNHSEEDMYKKYSLIYKKLKRTIYT